MANEKPGTPSKEPAQGQSPGPWTARRKTIVGVIAGVVVIAIIVVIVVASLASRSQSPAGSHSGSPSATPSASGTASGTPSATPSTTPTAAPIASPGTIKPGLTAQITRFEAVDGVAKTPGEVSGPSVRFTVTVTNTGTSAESLATTVVTAYYGDDSTPALELSEPGGVTMPASVAGGGTATGVYIFTIPADQRNNVRLEVDYSTKVRPLVFQGALPL
jgi:hypothetical protein